jgi:hypothetical protein
LSDALNEWQIGLARRPVFPLHHRPAVWGGQT